MDIAGNKSRILGPLGGTALIFALALLTSSAQTFSTRSSSGNHRAGENSLHEKAPDALTEYNKAAIACDTPQCASIGREIMEQGGAVADAAVATLLCMGVLHPASSGVGGGFLLTYYDATAKTSVVLNAREMAPAKASEDMFDGNSTISQKGGLAVAVPGEMKGLWQLYNRFGGKLPWASLVEPTIRLCENGITVGPFFASSLRGKRESILKEPSMSVFVNPKTNDVWQLNDTMTRPQLAQTLRILAQHPLGGDALYSRTSNLSHLLVEDLKALGGIMELEDLENYNVSWVDPIKVPIRGDFTIHSVPPPGSGVLLAFVLRLLSGMNLTEVDSLRTYQLIAESFKHAYAKRTLIGDPADSDIADIVNGLVRNLTQSEDYLNGIRSMMSETSTNNTHEYYGAEYYTPDDHGTAHLSIVGPNGDAIAVTSTVNLFYGAGIRSPRTGILFNDEMDDFSAPNITNAYGVPPSPANFIRPGKRPLSSMTPTIATDREGRVRLVVGTAGGTRITTATTYVTLRNLWFNETIKDAIDARRIHHQIYPMELECQEGVPADIIAGLEKIGHVTSSYDLDLSSTVGVSRTANGSLYASYDFRKVGSTDGI